MSVDALVPNDTRVEHKFQSVRDDITYHYMLAEPKQKPTATVVLLHGWPDLGMGWRYQVPYLLSMNLQVIVPDMLGYGQTSAPDAVEEYTAKKMAGYIAAIIKENTDEPVILGGHDWGSWFAWRVAMWRPELVRCVFGICVPFTPPKLGETSLEDMVKRAPNFTYQLQLASPVAENIVNQSEERLRGFINGIFGGTTPERQGMFSTGVGILEENIDRVGRSPLLSEEMVDLYVHEYKRHGLHGPCNWYRTLVLNRKDEEAFAKAGGYQIDKPAMLIMAEKDSALPLRLAEGQERYFKAGLKRVLVPNSGHWVNVQYPEAVNKHIGDFIRSVLGEKLIASL
ncbi:alpha/beta-hydrolase [Xylariaceae sp. FL0662B]|nr:alpha/beta-hydrolase [Xylariaceae sp. FL0662B]